MKTIIAAIFFFITITFLNINSFIKQSKMLTIVEATSSIATPSATITPPILSITPTILQTTPTITPTPIQADNNSTASASTVSITPSISPKPTTETVGKISLAPTIIIPHPSLPVVISPFLEKANQVAQKVYNPLSPTGLVELLNLRNYYMQSVYSPYIRIVLYLLSLIFLLWGIRLIDKSKIGITQRIREKIIIRRLKDKNLLTHYYES